MFRKRRVPETIPRFYEAANDRLEDVLAKAEKRNYSSIFKFIHQRGPGEFNGVARSLTSIARELYPNYGDDNRRLVPYALSLQSGFKVGYMASLAVYKSAQQNVDAYIHTLASPTHRRIQHPEPLDCVVEWGGREVMPYVDEPLNDMCNLGERSLQDLGYSGDRFKIGAGFIIKAWAEHCVYSRQIERDEAALGQTSVLTTEHVAHFIE